MSNIIDTLVEMGFPRHRAELAVTKSKSNDIQVVTEWLLATDDDEPAAAAAAAEEVEPTQSTPVAQPAESETIEDLASSASSSLEPQEAKSIKCNDCGKLFKNNTEVEFHAAKTGHEHYSESTEEKKPLTEDEKREQLAKIEAKLKQRRLEREERERMEALDQEKKRIRSGKELLEAKKKQEDAEMKKIIDQRKREKEEERIARQRVKEQIEQDKLARKAKFSGGVVEPEVVKPLIAAVADTVSAPKPTQSYSDVRMQIRLTNGSTLTQTFGAKEPLSAVRLYIEMNRTDEPGPFSLLTTFPKKVFNGEDYEKPLDVLGLAPSAVLIVKKN